MTINKKYRFNNGFIGTYKEAIDNGLFIKSEIKDVACIEFNRVKYNRMDYKEQAIYENRLKETKKEYRLYINDDTFNVVCKRDFDYFNSNQEAIDLKLNADKYCNETEINHLFFKK